MDLNKNKEIRIKKILLINAILFSVLIFKLSYVIQFIKHAHYVYNMNDAE